MKKSLLFVFAAATVLSAGAQNRIAKSKVLNIRNRQALCNESSPNTGFIVPAERKTPLVITNTAVGDVGLGNAGNAFGGYTRPARSIVFADPNLNAVIVTHRAGPACTPSDGAAGTGCIMFDYSKDGGTTWNAPPSYGPVYDQDAYLARYPNGVIFNPTGNTNADSAYISVYGPTTGPAMAGGGAWDAAEHGSAQLGNPATTAVYGHDIYDSTVSYVGLIPDAMVITQQGVTWTIDEMVDGTANYVYTDTLIVQKGVWNSSTKQHDYTATLFPFPVIPGALTGKSIAFAPNGQTGWIVVSGNNDLAVAADTSNYLIAYKTTDGGATWGSAIKIPVSAAAGAALGDTTVGYSCAFNPDASVDANGNLYVHISIFPYAGGGSIFTNAGVWGQFAVYTTDGGTTWKLHLIEKPQTFSYVTTGGQPITEYTRGQISTNWAADKMVFVWFDTDTASFPGGSNSNPNALAQYYDPATDSWDATVNLTAGSAADGVVTYGDVSYYMLPCGSGWNVPVSYQALSGGNESACVQWHYVNGLCITGVDEIENNIFSIADAYPNPTAGTAAIEVNMKQAGKVTLEISNMLGQVVYSTSASLTSGTHTFTVDAAKWNTGLYFYTVKSKNFSVTEKLVRE